MFASEVNPWARNIYALNFSSASVESQQQGSLPMPAELQGNIQKIALADVPYFDLLTAGFPCQPFTAQGASSGAGQVNRSSSRRPRGFRDPRGQLFWHVIRLLRAHRHEPERQPKVVLLENVPGLIKNDITRPAEVGQASNGSAVTRAEEPVEEGDEEEEEAEGQEPEELAKTIDAGVLEDVEPAAGGRVSMETSGLPCILSALSMSGYSVSWRIYDTKRLLPQMRERVYIVGIRNDIAAAADFAWPELPDLKPQLRHVLHGTSDSDNSVLDLERYRITKEQWAGVQQSPYFHRHPEHRLPDLGGVANTVRGSYRSGSRLYSQFVPMPAEATGVGGAANCISTLAGPATAAAPVRFMTPRECARLQGFPDSFLLTGESQGKCAVPEAAQYQAVGNAVPPPLVQHIAQALMGALCETRK